MKTLDIDLETYSSIDLASSGVYAYSSAGDFEILLFAYAFDDDVVQVVDLASGEKLPNKVLEALKDDNIIKISFNANFERVCLSSYLKQYLSPASWRCSAVMAAMLGLPRDLEDVSKVLNLDVHKMREGGELIKYFCSPCKPSRANEGRLKNLPCHAPDKWKLFKEYCKRDVEVESFLRKRLEKYTHLGFEQELWVLDQKINDTGIGVDCRLVENAIACDLKYKTFIKNEAKKMTGLNNPNSVPQLKKWLEGKGIIVDSLSKKTLSEMMDNAEEDIRRMLDLRLNMSKTSIKKYEAVKRAVSPDGRVRGLFQFYGANRTGRWSGKLVQVHNLPQNKLKDLNPARENVKQGSIEELELFYESVPDILSQLIRTAFVPPPGSRFIIADFSAIEARIIAFLAGEKWRMDVFEGSGKIYEASASKMFKVPIDEITRTSPLRQKGKIAELALGYQGGVKALISMGAISMGLKEEELPELVRVWRQSNTKIVEYWHEVENTALKAVGQKTPSCVEPVKFYAKDGILFITLPSGRSLSYIKPYIQRDIQYNRECLTYEGVDQTSKQWTRMSTYGGKLVENIVQATARDCLAEAMLRIDKAGYNIVMHVHDEIVIEAPEGFGSIEDVCSIMAQPIPWAEGLHLRAEGFEAQFYKKS